MPRTNPPQRITKNGNPFPTGVFKRTLWLFLAVCLTLGTRAQQNRAQRIDSLMDELVKEQSGSAEFAPGIFPSYRYRPATKQAYPDDNIFFSGLIAMRLMRHAALLPAASKKKAETVLYGVRKASAAYANKYGRISYNFWQTQPVRQFPGDPELSRRTRYHIPDDADDSAILLWVNRKSRDEARALQSMMAENVPGQKRNIRNTLRRFHDLPAYSTWLGDRMPPEFDFCLMANILYVFSEYRLSYTPHEWATITFLRESFLAGYTEKRPHRVSPQYKTEAACLYHLAFLLSAHEIPGLDELKPALAQRMKDRLPAAVTRGEALLLASGLSYLGQKLPEGFRLPAENAPFAFFYANLASVVPNPFQGALSKSRRLNYPYRCKAWETMLELEIELLRP